MNPELTPTSQAAAELPDTAPTTLPPLSSPTSIEDDFADESLGERQASACSLEEGCTVCQ